MKRATLLVIFINLSVFLFIHFTLLQPIRYQHLKESVFEGDVPRWKIQIQNKKWKGYNLRGYFCLFRILYYTTHNPDSVYKDIEKDIERAEIHQNITLFNNGIIGISQKGRGKKGYKILSSFSFGNRVFWVAMYTSSTSKKYFNAYIHFLKSLKIQGTGINPNAIPQLELLERKIPLRMMQEDKFINMFLIVLFVLIPIIMIIKIFWDGRLLPSPPEEMVKQEGYVDIFIYYKRMKREAFTGSIILTSDTLYIFKNRKVFQKIELNHIQQGKRYLVYKDDKGRIWKILPKNINEYKPFITR